MIVKHRHGKEQYLPRITNMHSAVEAITGRAERFLRRHILYLVLVATNSSLAHCSRSLISLPETIMAVHTCKEHLIRTGPEAWQCSNGGVCNTLSWQAVRRENFRFRNFRRRCLVGQSGDDGLRGYDPHHSYGIRDNASVSFRNMLCGSSFQSLAVTAAVLHAPTA